MSKAHELQDAQDWRDDKKPDMHPDLLRLCSAYERLRSAQAEIDAHVPPYAGPAWKAKTDAYAEAKAGLEAEFQRIKGEGR